MYHSTKINWMPAIDGEYILSDYQGETDSEVFRR